MKKRIFLTAIWAYVAWYAAVFVGFFLGAPEVIGPIVGALVGGLVWFAPFGTGRVADTQTTMSTPSPDGISTR